MNKHRKFFIVLTLAAAATAQGQFCKSAHAIADTWRAISAASNNWDSPGAWHGNNPPQDGDDLYFNGGGFSVSNNNLSGLSVNIISFRGAYTLTGNELTLNSGLYIQPSSSGVVDTIKLGGIDGEYIQFDTPATVVFGGAGNTFSFDADTGLWAQGQTGTVTIDAGNNNLEFSGGAYIGTNQPSNKVTVNFAGGSEGTISFDDVVHLQKYCTINFTGAQSSALTGGIIGAGNIIQSGSGTTTLSGDNEYSGTTTISSGVLDVTGNMTTSAIKVDGGTLAGPGGSVGSVTMDAGAITAHDANNATGTLTISSLTTNGGTLEFNLGAGSADVIKVSETANIGSSTKLNFNFKGAVPASGEGENVAILMAKNLQNNLPGFKDSVAAPLIGLGLVITPYIGGGKPVGDENPGTDPNTIYLYVSGNK
ncbi:MAG TPA: autotransporter-associated beta strand repeat-containing protein [Phycisphaerae bacterium]|nr:autotransporter-associated beta strand repeat-containing protein [Phycisphaerae bacterium]